LSENKNFASALEHNGITFIGPTVQNLSDFGDKTKAREIAIANNVPVVPGSEDAFSTIAEARAYIENPANNCSYPVIVKAAMGGGGRGIRVVLTANELEPMFTQASNEALNAFGDGRGMFLLLLVFLNLSTFFALELNLKSPPSLHHTRSLCGKVRRTPSPH
jgi:pyruvate carboxylase